MKISVFLRLLCLILAIITVSLSLLACDPANMDPTDSESNTNAGDTGDGSESADVTDHQPDPGPLRLVTNGSSSYVIIRSEDSSKELQDAVVDLRNSIKTNLGVTLPIKGDFINEKAGYREIPYEIVIGECNRDVSRETVSTIRAGDYIISVVNGTKLVIAGGNEEQTVKAIRYFIRSILKKDAEYPNGEIYKYTGSYNLSSFTLNGVEISKYRIVFSAKDKTKYSDAANIINKRIQDLCGDSLKIVSSLENATEYEIQLGDCGRGPSQGITTDAMLSSPVVSDGKCIAVCANGSIQAKLAAELFIDKYFPSNSKGSLAVNIPAGSSTMELKFGSALASGATMRLLSNNILSDSTLADRSSILVDIYLKYFPGVIGLQECNEMGYSKVVSPLTEFYNVACSEIGNTKNSCYTPILYRKDLYELVASDSFLYDKKWPLTNTKTLSWAVLKDKATGKQFAVINTHCAIILSSYDTASVFGSTYSDSKEGAAWREDNSRQILETFNKILATYGAETPVFIMGDMNAKPSAASIKMLAQKLSNCTSVAKISRSTGASYHKVGKNPTASSPIDHMFVTEKTVTVYTHKLDTSNEAKMSSDHYQLICDVSLN